MTALRPGTTVDLFLNDTRVGAVVVRGDDHSFGYGDFEPAACFTQFAPLFGSWSLLMHSEDDADELTVDAVEELQAVEAKMDTLHARFRLPDSAGYMDLAQVNIDGNLIEWRHA